MGRALKAFRTVVLLLIGIAMLVPVALAWHGRPGPPPWAPSHPHGPYWSQTVTRAPETITQTKGEFNVTTTTLPAYAIGGPFCSQCHVEPPKVNSFWHTGRYVTVSGIVVRSAPGIAVITTTGQNGVEVYHIRLPMYCQPPKPGTQITVTGWEGAEATLGELRWHMITTQGACPQ